MKIEKKIFETFTKHSQVYPISWLMHLALLPQGPTYVYSSLSTSFSKSNPYWLWNIGWYWKPPISHSSKKVTFRLNLLVTSMLVTDVEDQMCWCQVWDVGDRFKMLMINWEYLINWENHQQDENVANITMSPTSLSTNLVRSRCNYNFLGDSPTSMQSPGFPLPL